MTPVQDPATGQWYDADTGAPIQDPSQGAGLPGAADTAVGTGVPAQGPLDLPAGYQLPGQFPVQPGQSQSRAEGQSYGASQSGRGYDPRTGAVLDKEAQQAGLYAPMPSAQQQGEQEAANAREAAKRLSSASDRQAQIEADRLATNEQLFRARATLEGDLMRSESLANEHSEAAAQGARGRYLQQLQGLSQLQLDPTLNFTKGEGIGVAAAVFAQHFLAAGGLKVDVQGTLDKWTDRYVDAQMEKFRRGQVLADQDRIVWDMIRAEATDASDARARLRGMLLSQADTAMQAEAAKYGSQMALAIGEEVRAKIQANLANTLQDISRNTRQTMFNELQAERQLWVERTRLSIQSWATSIDAKRNAREQEKWDLEKGKVGAPQGGDFLYDISESGNGVAAGRFNPNMSKEDRVKAQYKYNAIIAMNSHVRELMDLMAKTGTVYAGPYGNVLRPDAQAQVEALRKRIRADYSLLKSGKATNETEQKAFDEIIAQDSLMTNGNRQEVLAQFYKNNLDEVNTELRGNVLGLDGNPLIAPDLNLASGEAAFGNIASNPQAPVTSEVDQAANRVRVEGGHDAMPADDFGRAIGAAPAQSPGEAQSFGQSQPDWVPDLARVARGYVGYSDHEDPVSGQTVSGVNSTENKQAYDRLVIMARDDSQPVRQRAARAILDADPLAIRGLLDRSGY